MEVINLLKQYKYITPKIRDLQSMLNEIIQQKDYNMVQAQVISDMPKAAAKTFDKIGELVARFEREVQDYVQQINELLDQQKLINHMLMQLDMVERQVIIYRYIDNPDYRCDIWDYISSKINYSYRQTRRIHDRAIEKINKWYKT